MSVERSTAYRIAPGWITKAALLAGSYLLSGLTVVADQKEDNFTLVPWVAPTFPHDVPSYSDVDRALNGQVKQYGFLQFSWQFSYWTFGMVGTWQSVFYGGSPQASCPVTVGTYDELNAFIAVQCWMSPLLLPGESGEAAPGGFKAIKVQFLGGMEAPAS